MGEPLTARIPHRRRKKKHGRPPTVTGSVELARRTRVAEILTLRLSGMSLDAIGAQQKPKVSAQRIHQLIVAHLAANITPMAETLRKVEALRLDKLQAAVFDKALTGNLDAIVTVLAIMRQRATLFGLNAPTKVDVQVEEVGDAADAKASLMAKLEKMAERISPARNVTPAMIEHEAIH